MALSQHTAVAVDVAVGGPYHPSFCSDKDGGPYHPPLWFCHSMAPKHAFEFDDKFDHIR